MKNNHTCSGCDISSKALKEECGVFGVYNKDGGMDAAQTIYYGLYALQHRGQESCGIAVNDDGTIIHHKDLGTVPDVFNQTMLNHLKGTMGVGHARYSTCGENLRENAQPLVSKYKKGTLTVAHNGNIVNAHELREQFENAGAIFQTTSDSEVIAYIIAQERINCHSIEEAVARTMKRLRRVVLPCCHEPEKADCGTRSVGASAALLRRNGARLYLCV